MTEFADELDTIVDDALYYAFTLVASDDGVVQWQTQTNWVGPGSKPMWEFRAASLVKPATMRSLWKAIGQPSIVVNTERALLFFMRAGGNAVIVERLFVEWFGKMLEPKECVPSRFGEGIRSLATTTKAEVQHAPSSKVRMEVLKRDAFRCRSCGQRPSEDVNVVLHVHHVRPFGLGGLTEMHNLLTVCHTCHTGLDPHFEGQLLGMVPDGLVAPEFAVDTERDALADGVRRYREVVAPHLGGSAE